MLEITVANQIYRLIPFVKTYVCGQRYIGIMEEKVKKDTLRTATRGPFGK